MSHPGADELYIGYQRRAPAGIGRRLRLVVLGLAALAVIVGGLLAANQRPFEPGVFEFGIERSFEGTITTEPSPRLIVERPAHTAGGARTSEYHLVAFGKRGAGELVGTLDGQHVRLQGSLIYREGQTMIEVVDGSIVATGEAAAEPTPATDWGLHTFRGEIVDTKCYFGVMKPGRWKPHRACATRCISGGVPPVLVVETGNGDRRHLWLADVDGRPVNERVLSMVAEPIEITGRLVQKGDRWTLASDPATYRRVEAVP